MSDWDGYGNIGRFPLGYYSFGSLSIVEVSSHVSSSDGKAGYSVGISDSKFGYSVGSSLGNVYGNLQGCQIGYSIAGTEVYASNVLSDGSFERKM